MYNYLVREDSDWNVIYGVITFFEEEDFNRAVAAIRHKKEQWSPNHSETIYFISFSV
jgi:hypothetical protein